MAKHLSLTNISSSPTILSHTKRQTPLRASKVQQQGRLLRPRIVQDALQKNLGTWMAQRVHSH